MFYPTIRAALAVLTTHRINLALFDGRLTNLARTSHWVNAMLLFCALLRLCQEHKLVVRYDT